MTDVKLTQINAVYGDLLASAFSAEEFHTIDFHFQNPISFYSEHFRIQVQSLPISFLVII